MSRWHVHHRQTRACRWTAAIEATCHVSNAALSAVPRQRSPLTAFAVDTNLRIVTVTDHATTRRAATPSASTSHLIAPLLLGTRSWLVGLIAHCSLPRAHSVNPPFPSPAVHAMTSTNDGFASKGERGVNGASSHPAPRPPLHAPVPTYNATATFIRGRSTSPAAAELTASPLEHPLPGASTSPALDASLPGVGTPPTSRPRTPLASSSSAPSSGAVPSSPFTLSRQGSPRHLLDSDGPIKRGDDGKALRPIRLYYSNEFKHVAEDVAQLSDGRVELCEIDWKRFPDGWPNLRIDKSAEMKSVSPLALTRTAGEHHTPAAAAATHLRCALPSGALTHLSTCRLLSPCLVRHRRWFHVAFLASLHSPETFFEQYAVCSYLPKLLPKSFKLFVPVLLDGHHGTRLPARRDRHGQHPRTPSLHRPLVCQGTGSDLRL